jgi:hypothetical protein
MRFRFALLLFTILFSFIASAPANAQYYHDYQKWEVAPFVGFETSGSYPLNNSLAFDRLRANSGLSYGTFIDYSLTENAQAEFMWSRNNTSFDGRAVGTSAYVKAFNSDYNQFEFGFLYMLLNSERKLRPFVDGGIGFAHESNDRNNPNRTLLMFGLGGGAKYNVSRHFSLRGDVRWLPARAAKTPGVVCDSFGFCYQQNISYYLQRVNLTGGFAFRF